MAKRSKANNKSTPETELLASLDEAIRRFAKTLTKKTAAHAAGEPEDQLKGPVEQLLASYASSAGVDLVAKGESQLEDRLGRPDFVVLIDDLQVGHIELKAPGKGANPSSFKGHDKKQWARFKNLPNLLYTDGTEWGLYREGELHKKRVRLVGDAHTDGEQAIGDSNAAGLLELIGDFTSWKPIVPKSAKGLAQYLAPFCRLIRDDVLDALKAKSKPIEAIREDVKQLLFPDADDARFADAYAQTVVFALLLARIEGAQTLDLDEAIDGLSHGHTLLSRSLEFLTDDAALVEIATSIGLAQRVINEINPKSLRPKPGAVGPWLQGRDAEREIEGKKPKAVDPWLYFYEDFLAAYDPKLRNEAGAYYTPVEVVRCQVRLIDEILREQFDRPHGFVENDVVTLDPALGTGTYLLGIIDHAIERVIEQEGEGAVRGAANTLARNLHGFEWMVGPYAVAQLRISKAIADFGSRIPTEGPGIYLTNTLESPHTVPPRPPLFHQPIAREHERALKLKEAETVLVILGNPPYDRHASYVEGVNEATTGGWVRHGGLNPQGDREVPILRDIIEPTREAGHGRHLKNLYNLYVYFMRWSLWKVFEHRTARGPGVISFITAASYLDGDAFAGLREHMRRVCDRIDIIDLGGEGRGARQDDNVFAIKTPVCIFVAYRSEPSDRDMPAKVRYTRIEGARSEKLEQLDAVAAAADLSWKSVPDGWQDAFVPSASGTFTKWPNLTDIVPWQNNGVKAGRTWVIDPDESVLRSKICMLFSASPDDRPILFKDSPTGCKTTDTPIQLPPQRTRLRAISEMPKNEAEGIAFIRYSYRTLDRQTIIADARFLDRGGPPLWYAEGARQIYIVSLFSTPLGNGPAATVSSCLPDLDAFRGSYGAKAVLPLYRDAEALLPNLVPGLAETLAAIYSCSPSTEDIAGYIYGVLAQPAYTERFATELQRREVRIPWTKDADLFREVSTLGRHLIWLHTYGERCVPKGKKRGVIPRGEARNTKAVPDSETEYPESFVYDEANKRLHVGGGVFEPVSPAVYEFEVSGLKVVQSWLGYRMKVRKGRKSSPLDDIRPTNWTRQFTTELLELLWVLESTIAGYPDQAALLDRILEGELFTADEFPDVPPECRKAPKVPKPSDQEELFDDV